MIKYSENLANFLKTLRDIDALCKKAQQQQEITEKETQDILHLLELQDHKYHEIAKIAKELTKIRRTRRENKNIVQQVQPLLTWYNRNSKTIRELENILGEMRKIEKQQEEQKVYYPKSDILDKPIY